jgi:xanthine dehydrogenase accessory factor
VALIASHHRARLVLDYLAAEGVPANRIARIFAPAGLDLGAATPEEIALSIVSQMVALRRGGSSRALHLTELDIPESDASEKVITQCDSQRTE